MITRFTWGATLLLVTGLSHAQALAPLKQDAFVRALTQASGRTLDSVRTRQGTTADGEAYTTIRLKWITTPVHVTLARFESEAAALEAAMQSVGGSSDRPIFVELRGHAVLAIQGNLTLQQRIQSIRSAAWTAFPWEDSVGEVELLHVDLQAGGALTHANRMPHTVYQPMKRRFREAMQERKQALTDPTPNAPRYRLHHRTHLEAQHPTGTLEVIRVTGSQATILRLPQTSRPLLQALASEARSMWIPAPAPKPGLVSQL